MAPPPSPASDPVVVGRALVLEREELPGYILLPSWSWAMEAPPPPAEVSISSYTPPKVAADWWCW